MEDNTQQLAVIGKFSQLKDVTCYEECKEQVRIFVEKESIPGHYFQTLREMDYEVKNVNAYSDHKRKEPGYTDSFISSIEIVAKPQE